MQPSPAPEQMSFIWMQSDPSNMAPAAKKFVDEIRARSPSRQHFLISCGRRKQSTSAPASELYISPRFRASVALAERLGIALSVLSAKHRLVSAETIIEPYNLALASSPLAQQRQWAEEVFAQIEQRFPKATRFIILADDEYRAELVPLLVRSDYDVLEPPIPRDRSLRMHLIQECRRLLDREQAAQNLYQSFYHSLPTKALPSLKEALTTSLPEQGVYFFFDPNEPTKLSNNLPRLVRIGTHGVSAGSRATLRDRLRTHFGTLDGLGNHRASVFRLHVGEALIRKNGLRSQYPAWGKGQNADRAIINRERELEREVSSYISELGLFCLSVPDKATKDSARSKIERLSIALFTESLLPIETPSPAWLGLNSAHEVIARTGLWNVRDVGARADLKSLSMINRRIPSFPRE